MKISDIIKPEKPVKPEKALQQAIREYEKAKPHYKSMVKCEDAVTRAYTKLQIAATEAVRMLLISRGIKVKKIVDYRRLGSNEIIKSISQKLYELKNSDRKIKEISEDYSDILGHTSWIEYFGLDELREYIRLTGKLIENVMKLTKRR
jgi:hypothetical protein